jgi:ribose transport system substrate-binding protein
MLTKKLNVLISLPTNDIGYHSEQVSAAEDAARRLGVNISLVYAQGDAINQSQQLLTAIQSNNDRPDAIVLEPVGTCLPHVAKTATAKGIGWVVLNRDADYIAELRRGSSAPIFEISTDHEEVGRIQGRQFAALLGNSGLVLYVQGPGNSGAAQRRTEGMMSTKPAGMEVKSLKGNWTETGAYQAITSWARLSTSRQQPVGLIGCQNDAMAMGARKAFQEMSGLEDRERWLHLPYTGCDGLPQAGQTWVREKQLAATVIVPTNTGMALEMLVKAFETGKQPSERTLTVPVSYPPIEKLHR